MPRNREKFRCRDATCLAVGWYFPADGKCWRCGRPGMVRPVDSKSLAEAIAVACEPESESKKQLALFD